MKGYGYGNYMIESSWKAVRGAAIVSMSIATLPQTAFWVNVLLFVKTTPQTTAILLVASSLLWLGTWWVVFDRLISYMAWSANYKEMYDQQLADNPPPPTLPNKTINRHYTGHENGYTLKRDSKKPVGEGDVDKKENKA